MYRNDGGLNFSDVSHSAGIARSTVPHVGWGDAFVDLDNAGWLDLVLVNGHVYPQVDKCEAGHGVPRAEDRVSEPARRDAFKDVSAQTGSAVVTPQVSRGLAVGDLFHKGRLDLVVENLTGLPMILEARPNPTHHWVSIELRGVEGEQAGPECTLLCCYRVCAADGRGSQRRKLPVAERSEAALWAGHGGEDRQGRGAVAGRHLTELRGVAVDRFYHLKQGGELAPVR